jgi:hypothetical protein
VPTYRGLTFKPCMMLHCQFRASPSVGVLRWAESSAICSSIRARFCRSVGLFWSQSATYDLSQFALQFANRLRRVFSVRFDRLSLKRILPAGFGFDECRNRAPEPGILAPVFSQGLQIRFEGALSAAPLSKVAPDGFNQQLIDRTPFDFAQAPERVALRRINT